MNWVGFLSILAVTLAASCTVGPDYQRPAGPAVASYTSEPLASNQISPASNEDQHFVQGLDIPGQWWTLFQSQALNTLVEQAMKSNPDLQTAQAALRIAQENVYAQQGAYYPAVTANVSSSRQKDAIGSVTSPVSSGATIYSLHTAQVNVAFVPDVFGGNRRQVESLMAQAQSQRFQLEAAYLALTSNAVVAAIQEASLRGQIAAIQKIIDLETEQLNLIRCQSTLGAVPEASVLAQEAALAQTQAALPPLQKQLAQQRNLLAALAGRFPSQGLPETFDLASLQLPRALPLTLPSRLVEQRPDVRSAEAQLHAASAQIGVATANRLPQFALTASDGSMATKIGELFTSGNSFWGIATDMTQPIFEGGSLLHRKRAAEAAYDQAVAQYRSTVITAFQNVADALRALQADANLYDATLVAERSAAKSREIARRQMQVGDISYLALLNAEQVYQQAMINRVQAATGRYMDTAALFQALGGGWWNRSDVADSLRTPEH